MATATATKKSPKRSVAADSAKGCSDHAFHVDYNKALDRWDVVDDDGRVVGHCHHIGEATDLAIREAQHANGHGHNVMVCVEQSDGSYNLAWSAR